MKQFHLLASFKLSGEMHCFFRIEIFYENIILGCIAKIKVSIPISG